MTDELSEEAALHGIGAVLQDLFAVLEQRKAEMPEGSYTVKLLAGPQEKLLKKIGEEASEVIIAARDRDAAQLRYEIGDLVYHLLVVMVREGLTLDDLARELASRRK
ncbi:MAG: phosphoribosyl-ATP diphosphatase [Anaerosomatales bacterium]|nr:phosphoribosyl-ATP diphosphatase [Anaerosomatales bacterium]